MLNGGYLGSLWIIETFSLTCTFVPDRAHQNRIRIAQIPHAQPKSGPVRGADTAPGVAVRLWQRFPRRRALHGIPTGEARLRRRTSHSHRAGRLHHDQTGIAHAARRQSLPRSRIPLKRTACLRQKGARGPPPGGTLVTGARRNRRGLAVLFARGVAIVGPVRTMLRQDCDESRPKGGQASNQANARRPSRRRQQRRTGPMQGTQLGDRSASAHHRYRHQSPIPMIRTGVSPY